MATQSGTVVPSQKFKTAMKDHAANLIVDNVGREIIGIVKTMGSAP